MRIIQKHIRPAASRNIRLGPKLWEQPDLQKLGFAVLSIAKSLAQKRKAGEAALNKGKGEAMR